MDSIDTVAEPRSSVIARDLREAILGRRLGPGERLPQESLAEEYGSSRMPVQKALQELADEGLVTIAPNVGARVARFDLDELVAVYRAREAIEPMILEESVPLLSEADVSCIQQLVEKTELCAGRDDRLGYIESDRPLHFATFAGSRMPRLLQLVHGFWDTTQHYRRIYGFFPSAIETSVLEHRLLLDLIQSRNAADAARLLSIHIRRTRLALQTYCQATNNHSRADSDGHPYELATAPR